METPNSTVITKQANGNILVVTEGSTFTLSPSNTLYKYLNGVIVRDEHQRTTADFRVATVEKLVNPSASPSEIPINDVDTLFDELNENFFFEVTGPTPGDGSLQVKEFTQTLNNGDNTINHNLGKKVIAFEVMDGDDFVAVGGNVIDTNSFNINLAGGGPINNAEIIFIYIN